MLTALVMSSRRLLGAVTEGAGTEAPEVLSSYRSALVAGMLREIRRAKAKLPKATQHTEVVDSEPFAPVRYERPETRSDHTQEQIRARDGVHGLDAQPLPPRSGSTDDVQNKRAAAIEWANTVTAQTGTPWGYLLVAERDIKDASGSWSRLRKATQD